jgi:hypothetical protein
VQQNQSVLEADLARCGVADEEVEVLPAVVQEAEEAQGVVHHVAEASVEDEVVPGEASGQVVGLREAAAALVAVVASAVGAEAHKRSTWNSCMAFRFLQLALSVYFSPVGKDL